MFGRRKGPAARENAAVEAETVQNAVESKRNEVLTKQDTVQIPTATSVKTQTAATSVQAASIANGENHHAERPKR